MISHDLLITLASCVCFCDEHVHKKDVKVNLLLVPNVLTLQRRQESKARHVLKLV